MTSESAQNHSGLSAARLARRAGWCALVIVAVEAGAEVALRLAERRYLGDQAHPGHTVVLVLGYRNRPGRINVINRWRVEAALATVAQLEADLVVFSGGGPGGAVEADLLADYALERGLACEYRLERESHSTIENLELSLPLLHDATRIAIVSDPLHAERARQHLWDLRPELAELLVPAQSPRRGWWSVLLPLLGVQEYLARARLHQLHRQAQKEAPPPS